MVLTLYVNEVSPFVRSVLLLQKELNIDMEHVHLKIFEKEQFKPEFLKINPQHTVPTLVDDDFVVWDSHAIMPYLVAKYASNDKLYPKDIRKRATVDQRLHFNSSYLTPILFGSYRPIVFRGEKTVDELWRQQAIDGYDFLNKFLEGKKWMAGEEMTIADLSLIPNVTALNHVVPIDGEYKNLLNWIGKMEKLPYYEESDRGNQMLKQMLESKLAEN